MIEVLALGLAAVELGDLPDVVALCGDGAVKAMREAMVVNCIVAVVWCVDLRIGRRAVLKGWLFDEVL
jgi:hypothetical protein